jgi:hypothetical protein
VASIGSALVLLAAAVRLRVTRRLELGVADRGAGAVALSLAAFCVVIPATAADLGAPDRLLPLGTLAAALACVWTCSLADRGESSHPLSVAASSGRAWRRAVHRLRHSMNPWGCRVRLGLNALEPVFSMCEHDA